MLAFSLFSFFPFFKKRTLLYIKAFFKNLQFESVFISKQQIQLFVEHVDKQVVFVVTIVDDLFPLPWKFLGVHRRPGNNRSGSVSTLANPSTTGLPYAIFCHVVFKITDISYNSAFEPSPFCCYVQKLQCVVYYPCNHVRESLNLSFYSKEEQNFIYFWDPSLLLHCCREDQWIVCECAHEHVASDTPRG